MSIYGDYGNILPWEIIIALIAGVLILWLGIRATQRADRRHMLKARQQVVPTEVSPISTDPPQEGE
jgi:NhaP-type Na+/H+ or K+/H+ antiporter